MSRHPVAEQHSAPADLPSVIPDFSKALSLAQRGQSACPTALALALGAAPRFQGDAERLRALIRNLTSGGPVLPTACGAFNRAVARRLAAPQQDETPVYLGAEPRRKTLPAKAVLQQVEQGPAPMSR